MVFFATVLLLCYLCEAEFSDVSQPVSVQTLKIGESVTIECFIKSIINNRVWYKLTADRRLQVIATYSSRYNWSVVSVDELKHRYSVNSNGNNNHLTISAASWDDAGTYFCGVLRLTDIQFGSGTLLMLKGVKLNQSDVQPPVGSEDAVPFSCTFHAAQCTAEDTGVMWLKTSQRSAPEVIHVSGKTDDSCRRTERGEMTCEHKLFIRDVDSDGGGTYYCAATVCGQTHFGNVTMVFNSSLNPTVVVLVTSNIIFGIMTLLLFWMLCKSQRKASARAPKRSFVDQTAESVIYSSLSSPHRSVDCQSSTVTYSTVDSVVYSDTRS
ncbi:uncharacterized protein LOC103480232 [Poecilia reticulata]|uniref:Uncharacterized LOC103480232 n=1 Tax=Poecilia reticulata TaxID=8081 RepID=A0A3P9NFZ1_POERE|nr:PREDICTED: uncharacterized protein LOC103480232 [Poecilia reticulata]